MFRHARRATSGVKVSAVLMALLLIFVATPQASRGIDDVVIIASEPPANELLNSTAQIESIISAISPELLMGHVQDLQDFKTRYSYRGDNCFAAAEYIAACFRDNDLAVSYGDFSYGGYTMRNVIGQKTGMTNPGDIYIICGHYDSVSSLPWSQAPGADDNGSGIAAVMAAAEVLSDYDLNCTVRFIGFSGEEQGLKGSMNYLGGVIGLGENIRGVLNLDMIAYNPDPGSTDVYVGKDYSDAKAVVGEPVYGPAPANDTTTLMSFDHSNIINCNLYLQEQGAPSVYVKLVQGTDYVLNLTAGSIDLSSGIGPLLEFENLTGWYNYSPAGALIDFTKGMMQKYSHIFTLTPVDLLTGSSDHAPFSPTYPALLLIERRYTSNPNYHKVTDTVDFLNFTYCANVTQLAVATLAELAGIGSADNAAPSHGPGFPADGGYAQAQPRISIDVRDPSPLNLTTLRMRVNGTEVAPSLVPIPLGYNVTYTPPSPYPDGALMNVSVSAYDVWGNGFNHSWEFTVDAVAPEPPTNFTISKSRIELSKHGLVLNVGATYDSKHAESPTVIFKDGQYEMWYAGNDGSKWYICHASSADGLIWTKQGVVLSQGTLGQPDSSYVCYPTVLFDGEYRMWYSGSDGVNTRILYANSTDGLTWVKRGIAVNIGAPGEMDSKLAYFPCVIKTTEYEMWYSGMDGTQHRVLYANSTDGLTWNKYPADMTPEGAGVMYGDGLIWSPDVVFHNGTYHMYCGRYDGLYMKTVISRSQDGLKWDCLGLTIDVGAAGEYDAYRADHCSIIMSDSETKVWYSAYNNANWRIMFANITQADVARDLTLSWTPSASADVVGYELYRESRPTAFRGPLGAASPEFYTPPAGQTPWTFETMRESNITVHSPPNSFTPQRFYMPDDNIRDVSLHIRSSNGSWTKLVQNSDYGVDMESGFVEVYSELMEAGSSIHAWYNHSAGRALRTDGCSIADVRAGAGSNKSYYYALRAVDRAGNVALSAGMPAKMGAQLSETWSLISGPLLTGPTPVADVLEGLNWAHARTWEYDRLPNHWTSNRPGSDSNNLHTIDATVGVWVRVSYPGAFATVGYVSNITINLTAGWNLVSYPYHEIKTVNDALAGIPWDRVEMIDSASATLLTVLIGSDVLCPGQGLWVRVTSDAVWNAVNVP